MKFFNDNYEHQIADYLIDMMQETSNKISEVDESSQGKINRIFDAAFSELTPCVKDQVVMSLLTSYNPKLNNLSIESHIPKLPPFKISFESIDDTGEIEVGLLYVLYLRKNHELFLHVQKTMNLDLAASFKAPVVTKVGVKNEKITQQHLTHNILDLAFERIIKGNKNVIENIYPLTPLDLKNIPVSENLNQTLNATLFKLMKQKSIHHYKNTDEFFSLTQQQPNESLIGAYALTLLQKKIINQEPYKKSDLDYFESKYIPLLSERNRKRIMKYTLDLDQNNFLKNIGSQITNENRTAASGEDFLERTEKIMSSIQKEKTKCIEATAQKFGHYGVTQREVEQLMFEMIEEKIKKVMPLPDRLTKLCKGFVVLKTPFLKYQDAMFEKLALTLQSPVESENQNEIKASKRHKI